MNIIDMIEEQIHFHKSELSKLETALQHLTGGKPTSRYVTHKTNRRLTPNQKAVISARMKLWWKQRKNKVNASGKIVKIQPRRIA